MKTTWGFRASALIAAAIVIPACHKGSSGGVIPNPGSIGFLSAAFTAAEDGGTATITVRRSGGSLGAVSVNYATSDGSATGVDYTTANGTILWADGDAADKTFPVTITDDALVEGAETVRLTLSLPGGGASLGLSQALLTLTDDDAPAAGVLQFSVAAASVAETGGTITVAVTRTGGTAGAVGVTFASADASATAGADYTAVPPASTLSWANGDGADKTFTVPILDDAANEGDEAFTLTLSAPTGGATIGTVSVQTVTILDSDNNGTIQLSSATYSVAEAGVSAAITLTRTGGSAGAVGVTIASADGTASAGPDYVAIPAATTVTWGAGDVADKTVFITIASDLAVEGNETVLLTISAPTGGAILGATTAATLTLIDDDTTLQLSSATYSMSEAGPVATITVTRLGATAAPVSVQFATSHGTASAADYTAAAGPLTWAAGDGAAKTFDVPLTDDANPEADETVNLTLSNAAGLGAALGAQTTAVLTILDNDVSFVYNLAAYNVGEAAGTLTVTVDRVGAASFPVSVDWTNPAGGTATGGGTDYTTVPATLNFAAADMSETFNVAIAADTAAEGNETFNLGLANPTNPAGTAVLGTPNASVITIVDDDINFRFSVASQNVAENVPSITVTVQRVGLSTGAVSVQYLTGTNSATAGVDYTAIPPTTINWADGDTADKTFNVTILNDFDIEPTEDFSVALMNPSGGTLATPSTQTINITNDDVAGTLQFSSATYSVTEAGPTATITVTRTGGVGNTVSAVVSTSDGTATAGSDYTALVVGTGTVTFPAGVATAQTVSIPITHDVLVEADETVNLALGTFAGGASGGAQTTATLTITDNDVSLQFTSAAHSVNENGTSINIPVSRTGQSTGAVSVQWSVTGGTAATPADFSATGTLSWADGDTADKNIVVTIVNNLAVEPDKTVVFTLNTPAPALTTAIGAVNSTTLTINEDDAPGTLQFTAANFNVNEGNVNAQVTLSRTGGVGGAVSVDVAFPGTGTATPGADFNIPGVVTVSWAAGDGANKTFNIPMLADALSEGTETIALSLTNNLGGASIGAQGTSQVSVLDAPGTLSFTSGLFSVNENGVNAVITVTRTGGRGGAVGATVTSSNGIGGSAATSPADFSAGSGTVSFLDGDEAVKQFLVPIVGDTNGEGNETFNVALTLPTGGASIGSIPSAVVTIVDDDTSFRFSSATYSVNEAGGSVLVTVERLGVLTGTDTVQWATANGSASSPADYTGSTGNVLTFTPLDASEQFTVPIINDALLDGNIDFTVNLSNPSGTTTIISPSSATVTITEDDLPGTLSLSSPTYTVNENGTMATITVNRTGGTGGQVTVNYSTSNGTAQAGSDYTMVSNTLTWLAGDGNPQTFDIPITNDGAAEGDETVNITLSGQTGGASLGQSAAVLTIKDDDATIALSSATYTVNEGSGNLVVTVIRTNGSVGAVTATVSTSNGTASAGSDYTTTTQNVTWNDGDTLNKTVNIPITDDGDTESSETFNVAVTIFSGSAVLGTPNTAVATITDNEGPSVVSVVPAHNATQVALDANVVITFSTPMDTALTQAAITMSRNPGTVPLPTINFVWSAGNTVVTLVLDTAAPSGGLANVFADDLLSENTMYTVDVGPGATAAGPGLPISAPSSTTFTTVIDATRPLITSVLPNLDDPVASGVANTVITVNFNEPMNTGQGRARIEFADSNIEDSIGMTGTGMTVAWNGNQQFLITITDPLPASTAFRLEISNMNDAANNSLEDNDDFTFFSSNPGTDSTPPVVTGATPALGAANVSRDAAIVIGFSELMRRSVLNHVTIGGAAAAGVTVEKDMDGDGLPIVFIRPRKAWEVGALTVTINCAAGGAMDLKGNLLTANSGSNFVASYTVVAGTNDGTILEIFPQWSGIQDGDSNISETQYESYLSFVYNLTGFRAYVNESTLTARDVSITHFHTGIPVKGHRLSTSEDGELRISRFASNHLTQLETDQLYFLRLNTTLRTSRGTPLSSPVTYTFSTRDVGENAFVQIPRPPEIGVTTVAGAGVPELDLRLEVLNPDAGSGGGQTSTVTATSTTSFTNTQTSGSGSSHYGYGFEGDATGLSGTGFRIFTFRAKDSVSPDEVVVESQGYVFNQATELTATLTGPPFTATSTPTMQWSWPGTPPAAAHAVIVHVVRVTNVGLPNESEDVVFEVLANRTATSQAVPADRALTSGTYRFYLGIIRFKDPNGGAGVIDLGVMGPRQFSVP